MNIKTKLAALLMSIMMMVAMIPAFALTASAAVLEATDVIAVYGIDNELKEGYATVEEAWANFENGDTWKLLANTSTFNSNGQNRGLRISNGQILTIDLNGFVLTPPKTKFESEEEGPFRHFFVSSGAHLTIKDTNPDAVHKFKNVDGLYVLDEENGDIEIKGGVVTGGIGDKVNVDSWLNDCGGAFLVQAGTLIIEGGNYVGNKAMTKGSVVFCDQLNSVRSTLVISGGLFVGNLHMVEESGAIVGNHLNSERLYPSVGSEEVRSCITGGLFSDTMPEELGLLNPGYGFVKDETTGLYSIQIVAEEKEVDGVIHYMVEYEAGIGATCELEGATGSRKCNGTCEIGETCTYEDGGEVIPAKGHTEEVDPAIEASCTRAGMTEGSHCTRCKKVITEQTRIEPLGHNPGEWTVGTPATQTEKGVEYKYCGECGDAIDRREIPALSEITNETTTPATTPATTTPATTPATNTIAIEDEGCKSVVGGAMGIIMVAMLGGCMILRKKED